MNDVPNEEGALPDPLCCCCCCSCCCCCCCCCCYNCWFPWQPLDSTRPSSHFSPSTFGWPTQGLVTETNGLLEDFFFYFPSWSGSKLRLCNFCRENIEVTRFYSLSVKCRTPFVGAFLGSQSNRKWLRQFKQRKTMLFCSNWTRSRIGTKHDHSFCTSADV